MGFRQKEKPAGSGQAKRKARQLGEVSGGFEILIKFDLF